MTAERIECAGRVTTGPGCSLDAGRSDGAACGIPWRAVFDFVAGFVVLFGFAWLARALVGARELTWPPAPLPAVE